MREPRFFQHCSQKSEIEPPAFRSARDFADGWNLGVMYPVLVQEELSLCAISHIAWSTEVLRVRFSHSMKVSSISPVSHRLCPEEEVGDASTLRSIV